MKTQELPPYAPTLIESTRAMGYSLETAVADIIDNSIAANASNVEIFFFPIGQEYIVILDNGFGMNEEQLTIAMQYGSRNPSDLRSESDLGRFGLGLKTASLSQCRVLTVVTKNNDSIFAKCWDIDYVAKTGSWSLKVLEGEEIDSLPYIERLKEQDSGTLVVWQNLDRLKAGEINFEETMGRKLDLVKDHLSLVFHRYLAGEKGLTKLNISVNGNALEPVDPFLIGKSTQAMNEETIMINGEKIIVTPFILPHVSRLTASELKTLGGKEGLRRLQGFYVYRNKRLLVWGTWFRMMRQGEMSKLARIRVDIPNALDDLWTLDIKKSSAVPPAVVRENLKSVIDKIADNSKRTYTARGKKETSDNVTHVWNRLRTQNGGYLYEINKDYPLLKTMIESNPDLKSQILLLVKQIEENIPLNMLYLDLTNDEKLENDSIPKANEVVDLAKSVLKTVPPELRSELLESLKVTEPFNAYTKQLNEACERGYFNDK